MINKDTLFEIICDIVPQYYKSKKGIGNRIIIDLDGDEYSLYSFRANTPKLSSLIRFIKDEAKQFLSLDLGSIHLERQLIERNIVNKWMKINNYDENWFEFFDFCNSIEYKTYENSNIGFTFIYKPNITTSSISILTESTNQKILDVLAESQHTYIKVGKSWNILEYGYINTGENYSPDEKYRIIPSFLEPYQSILGNEECGITRTKRGDLILYSKYGILASCRKGQWKIYDPYTFKNSVGDILDLNYYMGCNLTSILFDLSYKRHGALILFDINNTIDDIILNQNSILNKSTNPLYKILEESLGKINLNATCTKDLHKPLILELASVDGAIVFDKEGKLKSFGSIIKNHDNADNEEGARSTAAKSVFNYMKSPVFKISSDGEISILFNKKSAVRHGESEDIKLSFL
ncbi:diadenylate cyclase [Romboutsia sp. 1001216sp1]|uniref:diadenylate cyclase n=1 Tax=Romboutsia sp. 1001216sp1 TaxID=2986997 RepID=UPI00232BC711|nr:diadenylate cyclase [Romboutsia sp. 1001216sp1]MDB8803651.1 diadenylate cyclase [Romboutsia sp. 1001216sp1]MDB8807847.1 diadenylate cyclase [Romboutsia sp. 1001216sp1]MDB8809298.1 diadenylate cyclase [Romboutsia sp. 1001216sp1]MDB8815047.1 diadenylate cyclase [Romboutsia sp. 1001216sp1]MDB8817740.1 diadenylate cyclase [Romboutsia sp. 1001216sp1]